MSNPLDALEAAKLATMVSSQLREMDNRTDGALMQSNRIDVRKFAQNVVHAANPNAPAAYIGTQTSNSDEAQMLEFLNRQAMGQVPDISQGSPQLIPMPQQQAPQYQQPPTPPPVYEQPVYQAPPPQQQFAPVYVAPVQGMKSPIEEIAEAVKSIDASIKALCDVFIVKAKKKKKRKVQQKTPVAPVLIQENSTQPSDQ